MAPPEQISHLTSTEIEPAADWQRLSWQLCRALWTEEGATLLQQQAMAGRMEAVGSPLWGFWPGSAQMPPWPGAASHDTVAIPCRTDMSEALTRILVKRLGPCRWELFTHP